MARSKLSLIISLLCLVVAVGIIVTLFSVRRADWRSESQLSAASLQNDGSSLAEAPFSIEPSVVGYHETAKVGVDFKKVSGLAVDAEDRIYVAGDRSARSPGRLISAQRTVWTRPCTKRERP